MAKSSRFAEQSRVVLPGSEKAAPPNAVTQKPTPPRSKLAVSVIVKRKQPLKVNRRGGRTSGPVRITRAEYKNHAAAALSLAPHTLAPVADLPVLEVVSCEHILTDLTLGLG